MELRDKTIWLIGASGGIGAALVPRLVREGARLAISARREEQLREIAERHGTPDAPIVVKPLDVADGDAVRHTADELRAEWGAIDVLIYNAGDWSPVDIERFDIAAFEQQVLVNYTGMARSIAAVLPGMLDRRHGEIVGVASLSAYGAFPRAEAYGSSKAAANYLLQSLRFDARKHGIGVTTVNPGFVRTRLTVKNEFPMPFLMSADQAAKAIVAGLRAGKTEVHFPKRLSLPLKLVTALPRPVYEWLVFRTLKR